MKDFFGAMLFILGIGLFVNFNGEDRSWLVSIIPIVPLLWGLDLMINGVFDRKKDKLKEEILEELRDR